MENNTAPDVGRHKLWHRREALGVAAAVAMLAPHRGEACTFAPGPDDLEEIVREFVLCLARHDLASLEGLLSENFVHVAQIGQQSITKGAFLESLRKAPKINRDGVNVQAIDISARQVVQSELERYVDTPDREIGSCGFLFNYSSRIAVYDVLPLVPLKIGLPPATNPNTADQRGSSDMLRKRKFASLITALTYIPLPFSSPRTD